MDEQNNINKSDSNHFVLGSMGKGGAEKSFQY